MVDRKKLLCLINLWLAAAAAGLAILGWLHLLNPCLILVCVFLIGVGFAFSAPSWTSVVPKVVSDAELPSAVTLGGLQLNLSGIIGPALGGLLVPLIGANFVFVLNGVCFLVVILAVLQFFRIFCHCDPLRSICARTSNCVGAKCSVCSVHFSDSGIDAGCGLEGVTPQSVQPWSLVYKHGSRLGRRSRVYHSMAQGSVHVEYPHCVGEFVGCTGLSVDGTDSPDGAFLGCRSAGRCRLDAVCF
jgi:hypothetical protein